MPVQGVSVALCTHNGETYIGEQLASILDQTALPDEIVLSDDASTDATIEIAESIFSEFARESPEAKIEFVILRNLKALGVAKNFEQALMATRFELVALCDQDDVWASNRLSFVSQLFAMRPNLLLVHSDAQLIGPSGSNLAVSLFEALEVSSAMQASIHSGHAFEVLMRRNVVTGATTVIRRALIKLATPFPEPWVHDEWLAIVAASFGGLDVAAERLIHYRQHGSNQIGVTKLSLFAKFRRMFEPGSSRSERLLGRAQSLVDWLGKQSEQCALSRLQVAESKLLHETVRSGLPSIRLMRVVIIVRELRSGRYTTFGRGPLDAIRDLVQPLPRDR